MKRKYTNEEFIQAVSESDTLADALRKLGLQAHGGSYRSAKVLINRLNLDTSHFKGSGYRKGWTKLSDEEVFSEDSDYGVSHLYGRIIKKGLKSNHCNDCGVSVWRGKPLRLHVDHINGNNRDHRLENLRLLCPNCHSQTDTYCRGQK